MRQRHGEQVPSGTPDLNSTSRDTAVAIRGRGRVIFPCLHTIKAESRNSLSEDYDYDSLQVHVVIPLATCLRNGYAIPLGYAEFSV
jgi:hypothetical protein